MSERTDADRLDWLERMRADVYCVTSDEFEEGTLPRLLRFSVEAQNWKRGMEPAFGGIEGSGNTLRGAIDAAMSSRVLPPEDQEPE